ncbi:MAG: methyltransferase domain-containing protein [Myxacorys chilensis ATA2-1-KO14]|nr:methyltransferase domain-containing protein [Myxacorys chilensis ATA2-1-KO14]
MKNYKQKITDFYNARIHYDNDHTRDRALRLVEYSPLKAKDSVLDVATGTGIAAVPAELRSALIAAAHVVGTQGHVIGIDIATELLNQAKQKVAASSLQNIDLLEIDAEEYPFKPEQFDAILCSSAIVLLTDISRSLGDWHRSLKPAGFVAFSCYSATSFLTPAIAQACKMNGLTLPEINKTLGSPERCQQLLTQVGFSAINIQTEQRGSYLSVEQAKNRWDGKTWLHPNEPFSQLTPNQVQPLKADYDRLIESLGTEKGVWDEQTTFFVVARK